MLSVLTIKIPIISNNNNNKAGRRELWEATGMSMALMVVIYLREDSHPQTHQVVYSKHVQLFTCQLYLNKVIFRKTYLLVVWIFDESKRKVIEPPVEGIRQPVH